jgi:hypothetical protein
MPQEQSSQIEIRLPRWAGPIWNRIHAPTAKRTRPTATYGQRAVAMYSIARKIEK